jgi:hypothetical protein
MSVAFNAWEKELLVQAFDKYDKNKKVAIARELITTFEYGDDDTPADRWKAYTYKKVVNEPLASPPSTNPHKRMSTVYDWHARWFTGVRLFLVRANRPFARFGNTMLPGFFPILGLSYGVTLAIDIFVVLKNTFDIDEIRDNILYDQGIFKPMWIRFKNSLLKDRRPYRILNDAVWFAVNLLALCLAGPWASPVLNFLGFAFDTVHEFAWLGYEIYRNKRLVNKLNAEIAEKEMQVSSDPLEISNLKAVRDQIKNRRYKDVRTQIWTSVFTAILLIGMGLIYACLLPFFPPAAVPLVFVTGSVIALAAGSIFTGLGRRLYWTFGGERVSAKVIEHTDRFIDWLKPAPKPTPSQRGFSANTNLELFELMSRKNSRVFTNNDSSSNLVGLDAQTTQSTSQSSGDSSIQSSPKKIHTSYIPLDTGDQSSSSFLTLWHKIFPVDTSSYSQTELLTKKRM